MNKVEHMGRKDFLFFYTIPRQRHAENSCNLGYTLMRAPVCFLVVRVVTEGGSEYTFILFPKGGRGGDSREHMLC